MPSSVLFSIVFHFLSCFTTTFGIFVVWSWFCSCHGKCDCFPESGAFKKSADEYEGKDSSLSDRRKAIRNARELALFGREKMTKLSKDFFSAKMARVCIVDLPITPPFKAGGLFSAEVFGRSIQRSASLVQTRRSISQNFAGCALMVTQEVCMQVHGPVAALIAHAWEEELVSISQIRHEQVHQSEANSDHSCLCC